MKTGEGGSQNVWRARLGATVNCFTAVRYALVLRPCGGYHLNIVSTTGVANLSITDKQIPLTGPNSIVGRAVSVLLQ